MAPTMEQLGRRVAEWRAILLDRGLKVNAGESRVIVGGSGEVVQLILFNPSCCCECFYHL